MVSCFSFVTCRNKCYEYSFSYSGHRSSTSDLGDGTVMHCWIPRTMSTPSPRSCFSTGSALMSNAMWQWDRLIDRFVLRFNVYVPDLLFFSDSCTTRSERSESFQACCVMAVMEAHGVRTMAVAGISYGGAV